MANPIVGSTVQLLITVLDPETELPVNASAVVLVIRDPSGNESTVATTNPSTGVYSYFLELDEAGYFVAIWTVTVGSYTTVRECQVCADATVLVGA